MPHLNDSVDYPDCDVIENHPVYVAQIHDGAGFLAIVIHNPGGSVPYELIAFEGDQYIKYDFRARDHAMRALQALATSWGSVPT